MNDAGLLTRKPDLITGQAHPKAFGVPDDWSALASKTCSIIGHIIAETRRATGIL